MGYSDLKYGTPQSFKDSAQNARTLIIGSGHSTKQIVNYKHLFKDKFDICMVLNYSFKFFDDVVDYHLVTEKTSKSSLNKVPEWLHEGQYNTKIPRIINWKGIECYPQNLNLYKTTRYNFEDVGFDSRSYTNKGKEGLLVGPLSHQGFSLGSSMLCAIHFASIIGSTSVYIVGADFCFKDEFDHWYKDKAYRKPAIGTKDINQHQIVEVNCDGTAYKTTAYFRDSAAFVDKTLSQHFGHMKVVDFSNGLLCGPEKQQIETFFK